MDTSAIFIDSTLRPCRGGGSVCEEQMAFRLNTQAGRQQRQITLHNLLVLRQPDTTW